MIELTAETHQRSLYQVATTLLYGLTWRTEARPLSCYGAIQTKQVSCNPDLIYRVPPCSLFIRLMAPSYSFIWSIASGISTGSTTLPIDRNRFYHTTFAPIINNAFSTRIPHYLFVFPIYKIKTILYISGDLDLFRFISKLRGVNIC